MKTFENKNKSLMSDSPKKAREYALLCLDKKMYNYNSMLDKLLNRGFNRQLCIITVEQLVKEKLIDDYDFSRRYAIDSINFKKQGINRIVYELRRKKVSEEVLDYITEEVYPMTLVSLEQIVQSRMRYINIQPDKFKEVTRLRNFLFRKGFAFQDIDRVIKNIGLPTEPEFCEY